jgi:predicted PurR-regulated permease PerM
MNLINLKGKHREIFFRKRLEVCASRITHIIMTPGVVFDFVHFFIFFIFLFFFLKGNRHINSKWWRGWRRTYMEPKIKRKRSIEGIRNKGWKHEA